MNSTELEAIQRTLTSLTRAAQVITAAYDVRDERARLLDQVKHGALDAQARVATFERRQGARRVGAPLSPA